MNNSEKFREVFGIYATELWAKPEKDFLEWLNAPAPDPEVEPIEAVEEVREIEITIDYDRLEKSIYGAVYQAIKTVELDHLREG